MKRRIAFAIAGLALVDAAPSAACSALGAMPWPRVTFHDRTVPQNAELWLNVVDQVLAPASELHLLGPDDLDLAVVVERDGDGGRVVSPAPLTPGDWIFRVRDDDGYEADYAFAVSTAVDADLPATPVVTVTSRDVGGYGPLTPIFAPCQPNERQTLRDIVVDADGDIARVVIDGVVHATVDGDVQLFDMPDDGSDVVVSVFDFAGNQSEVVVVAAVAADAGCASMPVSTSLFAAVLLLVRRRRPA